MNALPFHLELRHRAAATTRCPFCREELQPEAPEALRCRSCTALHHRECFAEGEGCSACRSEVARRGRVLLELSDLRALPETSDPLELCDRAERFSTRCFRRWGLTLVNDAFLILAHGTLERLAERWDLCRERPGLLNELLAGEEGVTSAEVVQSAVALSELVGADPALVRACPAPPAAERGVASPADISMLSTALEDALGLRFTPFEAALEETFTGKF